MYNLNTFNSLQLKDIARQNGITVYYDMPIVEVIAALKAL